VNWISYSSEVTSISIEVKRSDAPRITPSIRSALTDLQLDRITVYYLGRSSYVLSEQPWQDARADLASVRRVSETEK
jgi:hypothetical protein